MKELQESDLKIGDILIYENQDFDINDFLELLSKSKEAAAFYLLVYLIPWFDPGDDPIHYKNIYHAAIWGNVNVNRDTKKPVENLNRIVEAGPDGIVQESMSETLIGPGVKNIYVYRLKEQDAEFEQKINAEIRSFYDDTDIPYSYETAWLLAVICSMRYSSGTLYKMLASKFTPWIADLMVGTIQKLINEYNNNHQRKMVACSTLVAMIYKNANYALEIDDAVRNEPMQIPFSTEEINMEPIATSLTDKNIPKVTTTETVVTPRQLFESVSVKEVGYLPYKGK